MNASIYVPVAVAHDWNQKHRNPMGEVALALARQSGQLGESQTEGYGSAVVRVDDPVALTQVRQRINDLGFGSFSIVDQLDQIRTVFLIIDSVLGLLGGIAGVLLAVSTIWILRPLLPSEVTRISPIHFGGSVLVFALLLSLAAVLAFGLAPALLATPSNLQGKFKDGDGTGRHGGRVRSFLAIAEISLAMVLLVGAGLLIRSFALVTSVNPGFDPADVLTASVSLPPSQYGDDAKRIAFYRAISDRLISYIDSTLRSATTEQLRGQKGKRVFLR